MTTRSKNLPTGRLHMIGSRTLKALEFTKVVEHLSVYCLSSAGRKAALALTPFPTAFEATEAALLYDECRTWAVHTATESNKNQSFRMASFPEVSGIHQFLHSTSAILDLDALWALREILTMAQQAITSISGSSTKGATANTAWPRLTALAEACPLPVALVTALQRCLSDDGNLRDASSPELLLARTELRRLHQTCLRKVRDFATEYNILHYLQDEFMSLASDRYVLPLKANFKGRLQGIIHDWSQTGETCYFEPIFLVEINNKLQELKRQEKEEERKVFAYLTGLVRDNISAVDDALHLLTRLDVLLAINALADAMSTHNACTVRCVTLLDIIKEQEVSVFLPKARHPLLALTGAAEPIDLTLRHEEKGLIISGGNAGGKTVCLKTLGLIALMVMSGLPVPVDSGATLPAWTRIHAFIGDEQSLDDHVSTFTAQIQHLVAAWEEADKQSLVLLDEFGAGTDPTQGAALAQAVLDTLMDNGVTVVAATHFPALKTYALTHTKARAASVLFDPSTKKPLFRLAYDQVGASQALDVAREHGLPESILRRAEHYLLLDGEDSEALIERLNALAVEREKEIITLKAEQVRQRERGQKLKERFERECAKLHDDVRDKAAALMQAWKQGKITHKQALKDMARLRADLTKPTELHAAFGAELGAVLGDAPKVQKNSPPTLAIEMLHIGQEITHRAFGKKGHICEIDQRRQKVRVDMGGVSLWASIQEITLPQVGSTTQAQKGVLSRISQNTLPSLRLDLRGQRADAALATVSQFLDKALLGGMESVEIVHGRGTGVLRKEVHALLRTFPAIADFSLAPEDRGGDGMTIVTFV